MSIYEVSAGEGVIQGRPHSHTIALQRELESIRDRNKKQVSGMQAEVDRLTAELNKVQKNQESEYRGIQICNGLSFHLYTVWIWQWERAVIKRKKNEKNIYPFCNSSSDNKKFEEKKKLPQTITIERTKWTSKQTTEPGAFYFKEH